MGFYESTKEAVKLFQKADNIELYEKILEIQSQGLDMQEEIRQLREENYELKKGKDIEEQIVRYVQPYITRKDEDNKFKYCAICWGNHGKLLQLNCGQGSYIDDIHCQCFNCETNFYLDK